MLSTSTRTSSSPGVRGEPIMNQQVSWRVRSTTIVVNGAPAASDDKPIVVLLHGTSGTDADMADPATHPGLNVDHESPLDPNVIDRGWHDYPNVLFWSVGEDQIKSVTSWQSFLNGLGYPTVNY